ncbi:MAG: acetolactate synthase small subunit [Planctomycetaceae bacterium]|jgi:acetolactate synthase-1/3 small subunit|nr:acetolactate synthase small subunit [Planctomycetaceae bacterium]
MRHVISALVQNVPGVLSHISGMLASRGYNIDSLAVGETEDCQLSRMTYVVVGDEKVREQVLKQLRKIVTVVRADDLTDRNHVERDLMLIKVEALPGARSKILEMVNIFRAKVVDVSDASMMIEVSGNESKLESFVDTMRPFGIVELVRSGVIAMPRG